MVKVHTLEIDTNGKTRAAFSTDRNGSALLCFYDDQANVEWEASPRARVLALKH